MPVSRNTLPMGPSKSQTEVSSNGARPRTFVDSTAADNASNATPISIKMSIARSRKK